MALRSGVRGGKGTSHPNLTMAEKSPPMMPTTIAVPIRHRVGSVFSSRVDIMGASGAGETGSAVTGSVNGLQFERCLGRPLSTDPASGSLA